MYLRMNLNTFKQLIHFVITQLLAQARQDIPQLSSTNESVSILVKHLESSDELLGCAGWLEPVWSVENVEERVVVDLLRCCVGEVGNFGLGRVLAESAKKVTERFARDGASASLVEQRKGFFVLCVRLCTFRRRVWKVSVRKVKEGVPTEGRAYHCV